MILERFRNFIPTVEAAGIPVAFDHFLEPQTLPYAAWKDNGTGNMYADNQVYHVGESITFELYTEKMDIDLLRRVERMLTEAMFLWERTPMLYIETEKMYIAAFTIY